MPEAEKDKLLLKLLKKDYKTASKLYFDLVETKTISEFREEMEERITSQVAQFSKRFYSIGYLNMDVRYLSGDITEHIRITRDKEYEPKFHILLLIEVLRLNKGNIFNAPRPVKVRKFCTAVIARCFKILLLLQKMHEDILLDYKADLVEMGNLMLDNSKVMDMAIYNGFDVNWLLEVDIPENLLDIHKDLRAKGYLK